MKPTLKAPGTKLLKLKFDQPLSSFAFKFNLHRYTQVPPLDVPDVRCCLLHQQLQLLNCCIARRAARGASEAAAAAAVGPGR